MVTTKGKKVFGSRFVNDGQPHMCIRCLHEGTDVHEYDTYDAVYQRDTVAMLCDSVEDCLDRRGYYKRVK